MSVLPIFYLGTRHMLEIVLINAIALSPNWEANVKPTLPIERLHDFSDKSYLAKGRPYESDYTREVERERRRYELDNLRHQDRRYYRDEDRRRRSGEEYRRERDEIYRRDRREYQRQRDDDRYRRSQRNSFEELEQKMERLERQVEVLERRLNLR